MTRSPRAARVVDAAQLDFAQYVRPGDTLAWGQCGAEPCTLTALLMAQRKAIGGRFRVFVGASWSDTLEPAYADCVDFMAYGASGTNRRLEREGVLDILPCHYSQFRSALTSGPNRIDVLMLQVAPADEAGRYSLSIAHEYLVPLIDSARVVIAEVNAAAPWTYGERMLRADDFDALIHTERAPLEAPATQAGDTERRIAQYAASLIEDGSTIQFGLGALPEAIVAQLRDRRDLGVHSGTIGDAVVELIEAGVVTNARKSRDRGVSVAGTMMGTRKVYAHAHCNAQIQFRATAYTHDIDVLGSLDRFVAINSALEVDLTGQVNAEAAGGRYVGAVGGALDFMRGAARSHGGVAIVALASSTRHGSRIVARLSGPVSTPRSDVAVIVTEHGVADLRGLTLAQRTERMLAIAPPQWREQLAAQHHARRDAIAV
ncbi:acetyl-CoA hydrolase [Paraburkholderia sp. CNPSo 3272]|uniref:acetyl-CoA hydrolase/transferase family protein n=1 Tax=Paraburkholderia sp. CNPSo 3272 TaxID=2940931 RepID=UPI0020B6C6BB|nr:acetyl-CoA hydrolase/transferase C-terminal domain-containing protein [Paraburkholderia sp. CNPSo 3272]MCP3721937.1 acetyl-CoA hydrolase [Paraburkholderia sp. CNPSo 3272]